MTAIDLIAKAIPQFALPEEPKPGICCVTGENTETIDKRHAIKASFTNHDLLRAPNSSRIGVSAWRVITHAPTRQSCWWCNGEEFRLLKRIDVRKLVLEGVSSDKPWCAYATTSFKKHGSLRSPVNFKGRQLWLFEMLCVDCSDNKLVRKMWLKLRAAQDAGISRPIMESLDISPSYMAKIGPKLWIDFESWAKPRRLSPLYQFLIYLLPSKEELEKDVKSN